MPDLTQALAAEINASRITTLPGDATVILLKYKKVSGTNFQKVELQTLEIDWVLRTLRSGADRGGPVSTGEYYSFEVAVTDDEDDTLIENLDICTHIALLADGRIFRVTTKDEPIDETRVWKMVVIPTGEKYTAV